MPLENKKFITSLYMHAKSLQSYLILCNPIDCCQWVFFIHGILQVRILEWVAIRSSRGSAGSRNGTHISMPSLYWQVGSLSLTPLGKLYYVPTPTHLFYHLEIFLDSFPQSLFWSLILTSLHNVFKPDLNWSFSHYWMKFFMLRALNPSIMNHLYVYFSILCV